MKNGTEIVSKTPPKIRESLRVQTPKFFFKILPKKWRGYESFLLVFITLREAPEIFGSLFKL